MIVINAALANVGTNKVLAIGASGKSFSSLTILIEQMMPVFSLIMRL